MDPAGDDLGDRADPADVIIGLGIGLGALFALDFTLTICRLCKVHQKLARRIQEGKASLYCAGSAGFFLCTRWSWTKMGSPAIRVLW